MRNSTSGAHIDKVVLEMQGGGETSSTGAITRHVDKWEQDPNITNEMLRRKVKAGTIETNAWRRQQEQFLVKGNVTIQTGGKLVFAVGTLLYDYLIKKIEYANLNDLRDYDWSMCIVAFKEDTSAINHKKSIPLVVDNDKKLFTSYSSFVRALTDQGSPRPEIFLGKFESLAGEIVMLSN